MKLFSFRGISVIATKGWFIFVALMSLFFSLSHSESAIDCLLALTISAIMISFVFCLVVAHEFGHALTAQKLGYEVEKIYLIPFGGLAEIKGNFGKTPKHELLITAMGPAVNLALVAVLWPIYYLLPQPAEHTLYHSACVILSLTIKTNVVLFLFNMIPCYPMDGGRFLRALLALKFGIKHATKYAFYCSAALGIPLAIWGFFNGYLVGLVFPFLLATAYVETKQY